MKKFLLLLSTFWVAVPLLSQRTIPAQHMTATLKATVSLKDIRPTPATYKPAKKKKSPNEEEEEERLLQKKKNRLPRIEYPFPVQTIQPINQIAVDNRSGSITINESPCIGYRGLYASGTTIPPDVSAAVGFDHIFMALNDSLRLQQKDGTVLLQQRQQDGNGFWSAVDTTNLFDPKMMYDPYRQRWTFVILTDNATTTSAILIAISQTADPTGNWFQYRIDADAENDEWFDYPSIGFNKNWIVITGNMFALTGTASTVCRTFIFNINELYSGSSLSYSVFTTTGYQTICPALTYDPNMNNLWCVTNDDVDDNDLRFFKVAGGPANPSFTEEGFISIGSDWGKGGNDIGPQSGTSTRINTNDHRVLSVVWRNGALFTAQTIFLPDEQNPPDYCTIQMVICDPGSTTVHQALRFAANNNSMYAHPSLAVNNNGDIIISCTRFTSATFPSACVLVRRGGTSSFIETTFKQGEDWYVNFDNSSPPRNRWGDYTTAMVDPSDDNSVWLASEYSRPKTPGGGVWATWWSKICSGVCNSTITVNTVQVTGTMRKFEASDIIYANSRIEAGSYIKLDAGNKVILQTGFKAVTGSKMRAYIEGCGGAQ